LGWEIARAFARCCHVRTEHLDAYANEGYLRTATQWKTVRRLVAMLDYHPAAPASDSTPLLIKAKDDQRGLVERGFQVKYSPPGGDPALIFETLENIEIDSALNELRLADWNRSVQSFRSVPVESTVAARHVIAVQGIGPDYAQRLKKKECDILGKLVKIDPATVKVDIPRTLLWEFRAKARIVLNFRWDDDAFGVLRKWTLIQILRTPTDQLAVRAAQPASAVSVLKSELRRLQIALDEDAMASIQPSEFAPFTSPWNAPEDADVTAGQYAIMVRETESGEEAMAAQIAQVGELHEESKTRALTLSDVPGQAEWRDWPKGDTTLWIAPKTVRRARLNGSDVVHFETAHDAVAGDMLAWQKGDQWWFAAVAETDETALILTGKNQPGAETDVYKMIPIQVGPEGVALPLDFAVAAKQNGANVTPLKEKETEVVRDAKKIPRYRKVKVMDGVMGVFYVPLSAATVGTVVVGPAGEFVFDGDPGDLESGQWVVVDDDSNLSVLRIKAIRKLEDQFAVTFESVTGGVKPVADYDVLSIDGVGEKYEGSLKSHGVTNIGELRDVEFATDEVRLWEFKTKAEILLSLDIDTLTYTDGLDDTLGSLIDSPEQRPELLDKLALARVALDEDVFQKMTLRKLASQATTKLTRLKRLIGPFQEEIHPAGYDRNETELSESRLLLARNVPDSLTRGKVILLEQEKQTRDGFVNAFKAVIESVDTDARTIIIDPGFDADAGFTIGNTVLRGNVVAAGHGEKKPAKVLGNGNAAQSNQTFRLAVDNVSFIQDATMPSGVRADIALVVDKRTWTQVATLHNSEPTDSHHTVRLTEDSHLLIQTGDGKRGRRLPTGTNNVTVHYRVGNGLSGNIKAGSISKPVKPHHLIDSVRQPLAVTGGNGLEGIESLRAGAPATVLTLERAVSLRDYASLAGAQSSVWQAAAFTRPRKRRGRSRVEVVVVPAGGGELGDLQQALTTTLQAHALPTVDVEVTPYNPVPLDLDVTVRVKSTAYEPDDVVAAVHSALLDAFALRHRRLGEDLYVSEVFRVVEAVVGVENSICVVNVNGDSSLQRVPASDRSVVFIDPDQSVVQVQAEEYKP
jgi:predicted flap endonuclease-1-like 5' DNA nuclease